MHTISEDEDLEECEQMISMSQPRQHDACHQDLMTTGLTLTLRGHFSSAGTRGMLDTG